MISDEEKKFLLILKGWKWTITHQFKFTPLHLFVHQSGHPIFVKVEDAWEWEQEYPTND
jgi:hypothetical protein